MLLKQSCTECVVLFFIGNQSFRVSQKVLHFVFRDTFEQADDFFFFAHDTSPFCQADFIIACFWWFVKSDSVNTSVLIPSKGQTSPSGGAGFADGKPVVATVSS